MLSIGCLVGSDSLVFSTASSGAIGGSVATGIIYPECGVIATLGLIFLVSFREIVPESYPWSRELINALDVGIWPLFVSFYGIVAFKVLEIILSV